MLKDVKGAMISAIVTALLTLIFTFIGNIFWGNQGELIFSSISSENGYINNVILKNFQKNELIEEITLIIDYNINIDDSIVYINGEKIELNDNKILLDKINPLEIIILNFTTDKKIDENTMKIIKNNKKINVENFNNKTNMNGYSMLLIILYCFVYFIAMARNDIKAKKRNDETNKKLDETQIMLKENEQRIKELLRKVTVNKTVFIKEMNDMEKEIKLYQQLLLKTTNKVMTKEEMEKMICKELKTFSRKKLKHLSYSDVYDIINELSREVD